VRKKLYSTPLNTVLTVNFPPLIVCIFLRTAGVRGENTSLVGEKLPRQSSISEVEHSF